MTVKTVKKSPEPNEPAITSNTNSDTYEERLVKLLDITDVQHFWEMFNNFDVRTMMKLRDSVHLFKRGVKPLWEDPRNVRGGALTFRVPKEHAPEFWKHVCLLAIGERLQEAVFEEGKKSMWTQSLPSFAIC